jgi:FixJ family two-component response regulator
MAKIVAEAVALPKDAAPTAQQRTALITRLTALGLRGQDLATLIAPGLSRRQIVDGLIAHCRTLPKG